MAKPVKVVYMCGTGLEGLDQILFDRKIIEPYSQSGGTKNEAGFVDEFTWYNLTGQSSHLVAFIPRHGGTGKDRIAPHNLEDRTRPLVHEFGLQNVRYVISLTACGVSTNEIQDGRIFMPGYGVFFNQQGRPEMGYPGLGHYDSSLAFDLELRQRVLDIAKAQDLAGIVQSSPFNDPRNVIYVQYAGPHFENKPELEAAQSLYLRHKYIAEIGDDGLIRIVNEPVGVILAGMTTTAESLLFLQGRLNFARLDSSSTPLLRYAALGIKTNPTKDKMPDGAVLTNDHVMEVMRKDGIPNLLQVLPVITGSLE